MNDAGKVAFTPKGAYVSTETYEYLDTVQYNGNCYAAKKTTTGNTPPTTGTYSDDYWAVLVIGGASVPVATLDTPGLVKAGADIVVNSDGDMSLKTDFEEQTEIAGLTGSEDRKTLLGKIAKAIIDFIAHKTLKATASVLGHVKISNSAAITTEGEYALDAVEKNASVEGTLAYQIAQQNNNLTGRYLGLKVKTSIIQAFVIPASFLTGEATVSLTSIGLPECTTDDYNICIIFNNHVVNGNLVFLGYKISTNNKELIFQMPLNMDYSGEIWVTGIAVASHK